MTLWPWRSRYTCVWSLVRYGTCRASRQRRQTHCHCGQRAGTDTNCHCRQLGTPPRGCRWHLTVDWPCCIALLFYCAEPALAWVRLPMPTHNIRFNEKPSTIFSPLPLFPPLFNPSSMKLLAGSGESLVRYYIERWRHHLESGELLSVC